MAEGARLESVYTFIAYRGFESLSLRQITTEALYLQGFVVFDSWLRIYSVTELCHKKAEKHAKPLTNLPI